MTTRVFDDEISSTDDLGKSRPGNTIYDQFRAELNKPVTVEKEIVLKVPARETIKVRFSTDISLDQINRWRLRSKKSKRSEEIDLVLFNQMVIVSQCRGIIFDGVDVVDENDDVVTFRTVGFQDSLNAVGDYGAVKELYVRDADILRIGDDVLEAAGYGAESDEEEDPLD